MLNKILKLIIVTLCIVCTASVAVASDELPTDINLIKKLPHAGGMEPGRSGFFSGVSMTDPTRVQSEITATPAKETDIGREGDFAQLGYDAKEKFLNAFNNSPPIALFSNLYIGVVSSITSPEENRLDVKPEHLQTVVDARLDPEAEDFVLNGRGPDEIMRRLAKKEKDKIRAYNVSRMPYGLSTTATIIGYMSPFIILLLCIIRIFFKTSNKAIPEKDILDLEKIQTEAMFIKNKI